MDLSSNHSAWALALLSLLLTGSVVLHFNKDYSTSAAAAAPSSSSPRGEQEISSDSAAAKIVDNTRKFLRSAVQSAKELLSDDVPVPTDKRERLCVVAGTSTLDGDKAGILTESLFSAEGIDASSSTAHVKLFLYSTHPQLFSRFLLGVGNNSTTPSWDELFAAEERHLRLAIDGAKRLNKEGSQPSAFMIPIFTILHSRYISNASCRRSRGSSDDAGLDKKLFLLAAAKAAISNVIPFCDHILLTNGKTYFSKFFASNVALGQGEKKISTVTFVSCHTRRAHDQQEFQVSTSCPSKRTTTALFSSIAQNDQGEAAGSPSTAKYHIATSGAIIPVGLIQSKALLLMYPAFSSTEAESAAMCCGEANLHWFWNQEVGGANPPQVEVLSFRHQSEGSRGAMIYENPEKVHSGANFLTSTSVSESNNDQIRHPDKPLICAVVRTYQKEKRTIRSTLFSLQTDVPPTHDIKIFVLNAADLNSEDKRNEQEAWLSRDVIKPLASTSISSRVKLMTFASLFHKNLSAAVDMFGYAATDAVFDHPEAANCTIGIVTNGDNLYLADFWSAVLGPFASMPHRNTLLSGEDRGTMKAQVVGTFFISRYFSYDVATRFVSGRIDLGAAAFTMDVYRTVNGFSRFGQQSGYDWAYSDGMFFSKVREVVPLTSQVVVERALFVHQ